jgi:hypothetical protein
MRLSNVGKFVSKILPALGIILSLAFFIVPAAPAEAGIVAVVVNTPTSNLANKAYGHTGGAVTVGFTCNVTDNADGPIDFRIEILTAGTTSAIASQLGSHIMTSTSDYVEYDVALTGVAIGTYDVRVGARQASSGPYTYSAINTGAVLITNTAPTITLQSPIAGSYVSGNTTANVQWSAGSTIPARQVKIKGEYSDDNGTTWSTIFEDYAADPGIATHAWSVPAVNINSARFKVTVTDDAGNTASASTATGFYIITTAPAVTISAPQSTSRWNGGTSQSIVFTASSAFSLPVDCKLEYTTNGSTWNNITVGYQLGRPVGTISYLWPVPTNFEGSTAQIRVTVRDRVGRTADATSSQFTILDVTAPTVSVLVPAASAHLYNGMATTVTFTTLENIGSSVLSYTLYLSTDGGSTWLNVQTGSASQGANNITWTPSGITTTRGNCKLKVAVTDSAFTPNTGTAMSGLFSIISSTDTIPQVSLTVPTAAGLSWQVGSTKSITWTASDPADSTARLNYQVELSIDGGSTYPITIARLVNQAQGNQAFSWAVTDNVSNNCKIQVTATNPGSTLYNTAASANNFAITVADLPVTTATIRLYPGWNLVSLPLIPTNTAVQNILGPIADTIEAAWYFSGGTAGTWTSFVPGVTSTLNTMSDGKAYLIKVHGYSTDTSVPFGGGSWPSYVDLTFQGRMGPALTSTPPTYSYLAGWNLLGYKSTQSHTLKEYLGLDANAVLTAYWFNTSAGSWEMIDVNGTMTSGAGYWIYLPVAKVVAPPLD